MKLPRLLVRFATVVLSIGALSTTAPAEESESSFIPDPAVPEAEEIFRSVLAQEPVAPWKITKAELLKVHDAISPPFQFRDSIPTDVTGSHAKQALFGDMRGIMLWGPYEELEAGHYLVVYRFQMLNATDQSTNLFLDVSHNACTRSGIRLEFEKQPLEEWQQVAVPLHLAEKAKLEYRLWPGGNVVVLDRVYVFKVTQGAKKVDEEELQKLPAGRPVADRTDIVTSPHTDGGGKIDISGLPKGAKVRCPYTGKYFRTP